MLPDTWRAFEGRLLLNTIVVVVVVVKQAKSLNPSAQV